MSLRLALAIAVIMVAFAANSLLTRAALVETATGPAAFAALRLASGAAVLTGIVLVQGGGARLARAANPTDAAALALYMLGFSFAYVWLGAGLGALILFAGVQVTMFAGALAGGEVIAGRRWAGAAVALAGLAAMLWPAGTAAPPVAGSALMAAAALGWGMFSLRGRGRGDPLAATATSFAIALPAGLAVWALARDAPSPAGAALACLSGGVTSGLGYALWYRVLPQIAASTAAVAQLAVPVLAVLMGVAFLGETLSLRMALAGVTVVLGVALALPRRAAPNG